jgi:hypothetical protein
MNTLRVFLFISILVISSFIFINPVPATEVENRDYTVRPDGSILYDNGQISYGLPTFTATDDIQYLQSDYPGASLVDHGPYWSTPEPSPLSGRFYDDGRIYLGKDTDHYVGMQPVGIFYVNCQDPTEREQLISLASMSLSVNDNVATYSQGLVSIVFTNSFSQIKGDVIFPNNPPVPTVSNPALAVVWEVVGHAGVSMEDGERDKWWFEEVKAGFPVGDIQNNGSTELKKKVFRQNGKIYLVEGVRYGWVSDVNRTDSHFIIDPTLEYNGSDNWAGTSGPMWEHGDGNLRNEPSVTTGLVGWWEPGTDVGSGNILHDLSGNGNDGTIHGATWNMTSGMLEYNGTSDYVNCGNDESLNPTTDNFTILFDLYQIGNVNTAYFSKMVSTSEGWYITYTPTGQKCYLYDYTNSRRFDSTSVGSILLSKFASLAFVRCGVNSRVYINGINCTDINTITDDNSNVSSNADFIISRRTNPADRFLDGNIGRVAFYFSTCTNDQINETNANYHTNTSFRQIDTANDYGAGQVLKYINVTGTDPSDNTTMAVYVNGSHNGVDYNGWELVNGSCNVGDNVTVPISYEYRYLGSPGVKVVSNTTYQPETNVIESIILASDSPSGSPSATIITLLSQTPSIIYKNSTGYLNISYGIAHNHLGLNNTSVSFIYRNYDYDLSDSNHSIRPPTNDLASVWNFNGRILRAANRNETPGLNFENNDTITGGDTYTWSGLDENSTKLTIVPVNSTYTKVYINATVHCIMPQMWYLDRTDQQESTKTQLAIHKTQNVLVKFWNFEIFKGNTDFLGVGYTDTSLSSNPALWPSDANPVSFYYVNSSYDPVTGGDPITSGYAVYMGSLNASGWVNHVYSRSNSNYVRGFIDNNYLHTIIDTTNISYLYYTSNTESSRPFYINMTNVASSTNVSFANTNTLWAGNTPPYTPQAYTPNIWFAFMKLNLSLDHKLYAADNNDLWGVSSMNRTNITQALFPPTTPIIDHFHFLNETDYDMDGVYYGNFSIGCAVSSDPDGGDVTHNLTLHYANNLTLVTIINNTFTDKDITHNGVYFDANFSSSPYYSDDVNYTLRLIATDDESETVTVWLGVNFTLSITPIITSYTPSTPVTTIQHNTQEFTINISQIVNVTWYIDGSVVSTVNNTNYSTYSNSTAPIGTYNVTAHVENVNGTRQQAWEWNVEDPVFAALLQLQADIDKMKKTQTIIQALIFLVIGVVVGVVAQRRRFNDEDSEKPIESKNN